MKIPENKVLYLAVFVVLVVTTVISYSEYQKKKPEVIALGNNPKTEQLSIVVENRYQSKDTDSDGLFDWEESLWGTEMNNPDTDGDNTNDGDEVRLGRNPKKAAPNDEYNDVSGYLEEFTVSKKLDENSLTSRVARSILYNSDKQMGADGATKIAEEIKGELQLVPVYKQENLITFDSEDNNKKMESYSQNLMVIQKEEIATALSGNPSPEKYPAAYRKMALRLSSIEVPKNFSGLHIDFVNNYYLLSILAERVNKGESDPLVSLASINAYQEIVQSQGRILEQIKLFYKNNGIIFVE